MIEYIIHNLNHTMLCVSTPFLRTNTLHQPKHGPIHLLSRPEKKLMLCETIQSRYLLHITKSEQSLHNLIDVYKLSIRKQHNLINRYKLFIRKQHNSINYYKLFIQKQHDLINVYKLFIQKQHNIINSRKLFVKNNINLIKIKYLTKCGTTTFCHITLDSIIILQMLRLILGDIDVSIRFAITCTTILSLIFNIYSFYTNTKKYCY